MLVSYMISFKIHIGKTALSILKYFLRVLQCSNVHNLTWCVLLQPVSGRSGSNLRGFIPHAISFTLRGQVRLPLLRPAGRHGGGPVRPCTLSMEKNIHSWLPQGCFWRHPILMIHLSILGSFKKCSTS